MQNKYEVKDYTISISEPNTEEKVLVSFYHNFDEDNKEKNQLHMFYCHKDTAYKLIEIMK